MGVVSCLFTEEFCTYDPHGVVKVLCLCSNPVPFDASWILHWDRQTFGFLAPKLLSSPKRGVVLPGAVET